MLITIAILLLLAGLYVHEMGHWVPLHRYGVPLQEVGLGFGPCLLSAGRFRLRLFLIGAYLTPHPEKFAALTPGQRFLVSAGGPLANLLFAALLKCADIVMQHELPNQGLRYLALFNLALGVFNLLPLPPLDGWRLLECTLELYRRPLSARAQRIAARVGNGLLYGLGTWALLNALLMAGKRITH